MGEFGVGVGVRARARGWGRGKGQAYGLRLGFGWARVYLELEARDRHPLAPELHAQRLAEQGRRQGRRAALGEVVGPDERGGALGGGVS